MAIFSAIDWMENREILVLIDDVTMQILGNVSNTNVVLWKIQQLLISQKHKFLSFLPAMWILNT